LLRSTHHYAIWDDHDFGPNDANGAWIHKDWALESFKEYWMNPSYGIPGKPGITTAFPLADIHFYMLDNRYQRTSHEIKGNTPQILGKEQIDWLIENLKYSRAPFKMVAVGGQVLNPAKVYENHAQYAEEREYLINRIVEEQIKGVIFLTGDRHHTELRKVEIDGVVIYDLTVSPLTSGVHEAKNESTLNLVEGTKVSEHNFGLLEFSGERLARRMKIYIFDRDGTEIWSKTLDSN
jgi:alkaline phosphatase D